MEKGSMFGLIWLAKLLLIWVLKFLVKLGMKLLAFGGDIAIVVENPDIS